ncbi:MAG: GGDEF domain-containing protein [Fimbriimonadaceae bacterium]|nr:GGDEF domain-containing protein [Fimbriimonadaceae bacterium]
MPHKNGVGGVKGRLDRLADLGPRAGFWFDRLCDRAESVYYWFAGLPRKFRPKALRSAASKDTDLWIAPKAIRRCPLRQFAPTRYLVSSLTAVYRWLLAHASARATLVSVIALGLLMLIHSAMGLSDGLTMAYVVPIWLATRLGGPLSGLLSVALTTIAMNHADSLRGTLDGGGFSHTTIVRLSTLTVIMFFIAHIETRLKRAEQRASTDSLTGLKNRAAIVEFATEEISRATAEKGDIIVAVIDCDRFKLLNDSFGHAFGDMALRTLARKLEASIGDKGAVARLGGDEFVAIFTDATAEEATKMLDRGSDRFLRHMLYFGWERTMTYGIAELHQDGRDFETLLRKADERLYERKRSTGQIQAVIMAKPETACL